MEQTNDLNDLFQQGRKQLGELQQQLEKLAQTAGKAITIAGGEAGKKAEEVMREMKINMEAAATVAEEKAKEKMGPEQYRKFEEEGKKAVENAQAKLKEVSARVNEIADEFEEKLRNIFGGK